MDLSVDKLRNSAGGEHYTFFLQDDLTNLLHTFTSTCFSFDIVIGAAECD